MDEISSDDDSDHMIKVRRRLSWERTLVYFYRGESEVGAYPFLGSHVVEVLTTVERIGTIPLQRPLGLVTRHCFLERATIVTMPATC